MITSLGGVTREIVPSHFWIKVEAQLLYCPCPKFTLPVARDTPQTLGSRSPVRLAMPGFLVSNVSQKIGAVSPNCIPHALDVLVPRRLAEQEAVVPPLEPVQLHANGPLPDT